MNVQDSHYPIDEIRKRLELSQQQVLEFGRDFAKVFRQEREKRNKLQEVHLKLRAILDGMSDAMVATDRQLYIQDYNPAFCQLMPPNCHSIKGKSLAEIMPVNDIQKKIDTMQNENQYTIHFEFTFPNWDEHIFWTTISKFIVKQTLAEGYIFLFRDITEMKRLDRLRGHFVTLASKEIQNPLQGLLELLYLVFENIKTRLNPDELTYFKFLLNSGENFRQIISGVIQTSSFQSNQLVKKMVQLDQLIKEIVSSRETIARNHRIQLSCQIQNASAVFVDKDLLQKAIENIFDSFIKYTEQKGRILVLLARSESSLQLLFGCPDIADHDWQELVKTIQSPSNGADIFTDSDFSLALAKDIIEWNNGKILIPENKQLTMVFPFDRSKINKKNLDNISL